MTDEQPTEAPEQTDETTEETPAQDFDPVMDSITAAEAEVEQPDVGEPAYINADYEKAKLEGEAEEKPKGKTRR